MARVRIALLGAGLIGREHAKLIERHPGATLAAIVDVTPAGEAYAREHGVAFHSDYERMLDDVRPDGAIVALPNMLHLPAGLACVRRKIPVLVEKPVADTVASALALVTAAESSGIPILVGHHRRHSPDMQAAREAIARGDLGAIIAVNGMCLVRKHDSYFEAEWRRRPGGGPLLINAIHDIDCFRFLAGEIDPRRGAAPGDRARCDDDGCRDSRDRSGGGRRAIRSRRRDARLTRNPTSPLRPVSVPHPPLSLAAPMPAHRLTGRQSRR